MSRLRGLLRDVANPIEMDLLEKCLMYNPLQRISAQEALQHEYFKNYSYPMLEGGLSPQCHPGESYENDSINSQKLALVNLHKTTLGQYTFFRTLEDVRSHYIIAESNIYNSSTRTDIVDWLIGIMDLFNLLMSSRTVYFAIALIDAYMLNEKCVSKDIQRNHDLRLVAATSLYIASKCEDVSHIGIGNLAFHSDIEHSSFESSDILATEEALLNALDFDIYLPTVIDYLRIQLHCVPELSDVTLGTFAKYMAETSLLHWRFLNFPPSMIAVSICAYSLLAFKQPHHFPANLAALSFYSYPELVGCLIDLRDCHRIMPTFGYSTVFRRYTKQEFRKVALLPPVAQIPPFAT